MGAAYFIVLDREIAGVDPFVNGKAVARESDRLALITQALVLRDINEFVSANPEDLMETAEELGIELPNDPPPEAWYTPDEGLAWIARMQDHLRVHPSDVDNADAVLADPAEYRELLNSGKAHDVRWHFAVDF